jgi:hypothetical protein
LCRAVSTGLNWEINPVGSLNGKSWPKPAKPPMISVPKMDAAAYSSFYEKFKRFADRFLRLYLVLGLGSDIIGRLALTSFVLRTDIIDRYRHHR